MCVSESTPITSGGENSRLLVKKPSDKSSDTCRSHRLPDVIGFTFVQRPQRRPWHSCRQPHVFHRDLETRYPVFGRNGGVRCQHFQLKFPRPLVISVLETALNFLTLRRRDVAKRENPTGGAETERRVEKISGTCQYREPVRCTR